MKNPIDSHPKGYPTTQMRRKPVNDPRHPRSSAMMLLPIQRSFLLSQHCIQPAKTHECSANLVSSLRDSVYMIIQILPPTTTNIASTVNTPAPALSPVVMADCAAVGEVLASLPALGLLSEVPPVVIDLGAMPELMVVAPITLRACIWDHRSA